MKLAKLNTKTYKYFKPFEKFKHYFYLVKVKTISNFLKIF